MGRVTLRGVEKRYRDTEVIRGIDLEVRDGEFMVFVGPSGCGKSTMLRMIAGLETISAGEIAIDGERANERGPSERGAAMVFQNYALYPHMTVADNMGFALRVAAMPAPAIRAAVESAAAMLRIGDLLGRYPKELSGGQRQRVAIGRAIVRKPRVFLFDEPLSNLDAALRVQMRIELSRLHSELKTTMIYVTHDQVEAMTMGDRIAVFSGGRIAQVGTPLEVYFNPADEFVATFIGSPRINLLDVEPADGRFALRGGAGGLAWPPGFDAARASRVARVGVRAEHLRLTDGAAGGAAAAEHLPGRVELREHLGSEVILYVKIEGVLDLLTVKAAAGSPLPQVGDALRVSVDQAIYFDAGGQRVAT
jgi:multiple sugar transport system ATP-binding protein